MESLKKETSTQLIRRLIFKEHEPSVELQLAVRAFIESRRSTASRDENLEFDCILTELNHWRIDESFDTYERQSTSRFA